MRIFFATIVWLLALGAAYADCITPSGYTRWGSSHWRITETMPGAAPWERLPAIVPSDISKDVKDLGRFTAGIAIHIASNTDTLRLCWAPSAGSSSYPIWSQTGVSGIDVYYRSAGTANKWRYLTVGEATTPSDNVLLAALGTSEAREFLIYLPMSRRFGTFRVEVPSPYTVTAGAAPSSRPLVVYGSSIVEGSGTSRAGIGYPQALGRYYDRDTINLGFAGSCQMFAGMATLLGNIDASAFIIDCFPNMTTAMITAQMGAFLTTLAMARPTVPIYVVQDRLNQAGGPHPGSIAKQNANKAAALAVMATLTAYTNIHWISADDLLGDDYEGTVDGSHPSDLGHYRYFEDLRDAIGPL